MRNEREWLGNCHRCGKKVDVHTMSKFNLDLLCLGCWTEEREHPDYEKACQAENDAVLRGDYNFPGIGFPQEKIDPRPANLFREA